MVARVVLVGLALLSSAIAANDVLAPSLHRALRSCGRINVLVSVRDQRPASIWTPSSVATAATTNATATNATRPACPGGSDDDDSLEALVGRLEAFAAQSHRQVMELVQQQQEHDPEIKAASLWVDNRVSIRHATPEFLQKLAHVASVSSVVEDRVVPAPQTSPSAATNASTSIGWGVKMIGAPEAWAMGITGKNVVVGVIDSGVRSTHSAFAGTSAGDNAWSDALDDNAAVPEDLTGHGTSVLSVIVGQNGYGVAPRAKWMTCRACDENGCEESRLLTCAQKLVCPVRGDCSARPQVINLSFNDEKGMTYFDPVLQLFAHANIVTVLANGNVGPSCSSVQAPAEGAHDAITVGATDATDILARFSARGPGLDGAIKPDLSAPGVAIPVAYFDADDSFVKNKGTSLAAPHVAGAVALLLEAKPGMSPAEIKDLLLLSSTTDSLKPAPDSCGTQQPNVPFPNNDYGYGRLNVLAALEKVRGSQPKAHERLPVETASSDDEAAPGVVHASHS